ncbi:hypothetical protein Tco_0064808 [Tanacetum coccineum]
MSLFESFSMLSFVVINTSTPKDPSTEIYENGVVYIGTPRYLSLVVPLKKVGDEAVHKELGDRMERAATTASSLEAEQDVRIEKTKRSKNDQKPTRNEKKTKSQEQDKEFSQKSQPD